MNNRMLPDGVASFNVRYSKYLHRSKQRGTDFTLTKSEFKSISERHCAYCGAPPTKISSTKHLRLNGQWACNSLDRIDPKQGYVKGNVVPCCTPCNRMKSDMDVADFLSQTRKITEYLEASSRKD